LLQHGLENEMDPDVGGLMVNGPAELTDQGVLGRAARLVNREEPYGYFETVEPIEALKGQQQYTVELWYYTDEKYSVKTNNSTASLIVWYDPLERSEDAANNPLMIELLNDFWVNREDQEGFPEGWLKDSIRIYPGFIGDSDPKRQFFTKQPYPIRKWQHLVLVKQEQSVQFYLDGQLVESVPDTLPSSDAPMIRLGRSIIGLLDHHDERELNEGDHRSLRGRLDEVAIYDKPLTAEQVARHFDLAKGQESP
ncbi:MAG: LamG domain-containing protein, partial [Planctomycetota bacterium]